MMELEPLTDQWQEAAEVISNMLRQEATTYKREDYIAALATRTAPGETIDGAWRQRIIEWMYGVIDHCNLRRESVAVATYFLDLSSARGLVKCRVDFQLIAMTSLLLSIKLNDSTMVKLDSMVRLGRGLFNESDVVAMEKKILHAFGWHVHPPTPVCFMRQLLRLMPLEASPIARYMIVEVTRFISEISSCLYKFVKYSASTMATAAVVVAMERVEGPPLPIWQRNQFMYNVCFYTGLDRGSVEVCQAIDDLRVSLDKNVNLEELMRTINAQCNRGPCLSVSKQMDSDEVSSPHSPREVHIHNFR
jgi:hypothetical protein